MPTLGMRLPTGQGLNHFRHACFHRPRAVRRTRASTAPLLAAVVLALGIPSASGTAVSSTYNSQANATDGDYHDGTFGQAAREYCDSTSIFTPSRHIRTKIVRSTDGWSNTIMSRYRKFTHCTARQLSSKLWCTTKLVDGFSKMCITPRPKAGGASPCRQPRLDVRGVYHPKTGRLEITCVNKH